MQWIDLLIPIAIIIVYLLQKTRGQEGEEAVSEDEQERRRRVQEEIRRRMAERQGGGGVETPPRQEVPSFHEDTASRQRSFTSGQEPQMPPSAQPQSGGGRDIMEELRRQRERARETHQAARAARRDAEEASPIYGSDAALGRVTRSRRHLSIMKDLRSSRGLQRAFILREVLGPPTALRPVRDTFTDLS